MNHNFTEQETKEIIRHCLSCGCDLLPYLCQENYDCWSTITLFIKTVKKYNITPELYWHGNKDEFTCLLSLLNAGYPAEDMLLALARKETSGEIRNIADHHFQHFAAMFCYVKRHHGYDVLRPTPYMVSLYPDAKDHLYVYTEEKWRGKERNSIGKAFVILPENQLDDLPGLIHKKIFGW